MADEGGFWPAFATNEEGLELLLRAIEAAGYRLTSLLDIQDFLPG
ncbi:MAG: hypothetical protein ACK56Q_04335 [Pirellulaceae bacterium]